MSLDDKLREILEDWYPGTQYEEVIPRLKQVFTDEGYFNLKTTTVNGERWMSGQEFYDRFVDELKTNPSLDYSIFNPIYKAAQRAAGLS